MKTIFSRPLWISSSRSPWCDILMAKNFDVHNYIALCRDHYEKVGLGADYVKTLFR